MNLDKLFHMQKALDDRIVKEHGLEGQDLFSNTVLALLVEIGELANETRCFKHWSNKGPSEREVILEEYVDGIHFFLSLAISKNDKLKDFTIYKNSNNDLTQQFLEIKYQVSELYRWSHKSIHIAFGYYIGLGEILGFTWEEIEQAYLEKNAVNHQRQDNHY